MKRKKPPSHETKRAHHGYVSQRDLQSPSLDTGSAAGYDLRGIGGENIHDNPEPMGRSTRRATPLDSHEGVEQRTSDYDHPGERGFRYRSRHDGV